MSLSNVRMHVFLPLVYLFLAKNTGVVNTTLTTAAPTPLMRLSSFHENGPNINS